MPGSILIVDDDELFRTLAARTLRVWGYAPIDEAGTVAAALDLAGELRPDAVLVDVGLPDGDGFTLARMLAAMAWHPLVVLVSADGDFGYHAAARQAQAAGFVAKQDFPDARSRSLLAAA